MSLNKRPKPRVLFFQPSLNPPGGGPAVAAWMLEALKESFEVHLLSWEPPDIASINRYYGTSLRPADFIPIPIPGRYRWLARMLPDSKHVQRRSLLLRRAKKVSADYDLRICSDNECDLGSPAIQYIHYPWMGAQFKQWRRSATKTGIGNSVLAVIRGHIRFWMMLSSFSFEQVCANLTLANSNWTAQKIREIYDIPVTTLYPPAPDIAAGIPWECREDGIVCIGRFIACKQYERVIRVVEAARAMGKNVHLHLAGSKDIPGRDRYYDRIKALAGQRSDWIHFEENLSRHELLELIGRHRFGIHAMEEEHFGMAVAEMSASGTLVFIPRTGGPQEIVGEEDALQYSSEQELLNKMIRLMNDTARQARLSNALQERSTRFAAHHFCRMFQKIANDYLMMSRDAQNQSSILPGSPYGLPRN